MERCKIATNPGTNSEISTIHSHRCTSGHYEKYSYSIQGQISTLIQGLLNMKIDYEHRCFTFDWFSILNRFSIDFLVINEGLYILNLIQAASETMNTEQEHFFAYIFRKTKANMHNYTSVNQD
jgi:hypothetical protein